MGKKTKKGGKAKKDGKKKQEEEEEITLEMLQNAFKKECRINNVASNIASPINDIFDSYQESEEDKGDLKQLCVVGLSDIDINLFNSPQKNNNNNINISSNSINDNTPNTLHNNVLGCLSDSIIKSKYKKLNVLCFWRCKISDFGIECGISQLIQKLSTLKKIELKDCDLGGIIWKRSTNKTDINNNSSNNLQYAMKGIQSLSKSLLINNRTLKSLSILRLDFNKQIGSNGLLLLSNGLQHNRCIKTLSFGYCNIIGNNQSIESLFNIFNNCYLLEELNLEGNNLSTKGTLGIISGMNNIKSKTFKKLDLNSNGIGENIDSFSQDNTFITQNDNGININNNNYNDNDTITSTNRGDYDTSINNSSSARVSQIGTMRSMSSVATNQTNENKENYENYDIDIDDENQLSTQRQMPLNNDLQIISALANQFYNYDKLTNIYLHGNFFDENVAAIFLKMLSEAKHISTFTVPHTLPAEIVNQFSEITEKHAPKKSKKGGKKSKKSKKKKKK